MSQEAKILIGIGIATLIIVVSAAFLFGGNSSPTNTNPKISADQTKILIRPDSYAKDTKGAKITLVEFGDFECPACGAAYPIVTQVLNDYKGKINFVFREFPLPSHPNGPIGAEAAEAAGAQGKFFEMYDALYQNQKDWGEDKNPMQFFEKYAKNIGLDVEKFKSEIAANKYSSKIQKDIADGTALNVNATPTFFLNGEQITGGLPYDQFKNKIDAALKNSK
ncbi:MAG TPA: thioredoxin domain-containing protein [Patescibacteria group bacterium]